MVLVLTPPSINFSQHFGVGSPITLEKLFILLGYRQLSADSKIKNYIWPQAAKGPEQQNW